MAGRKTTYHPPASITKAAPRGLAKLTPALAKGLCKAIKEHPTYRTACHSQGISHHVVKDWLRRGAMPGAEKKLSDFTRDFFKSDSANAAKLYTSAMKDLNSKDGVKIAAARIKLQECHYRWRDRDDLASILDGAVKKTDNIDILLMNPSIKLREALTRTGWLNLDTMAQSLNDPSHPVFRHLIDAGWKPPAIDVEGEES